MKELIKINTAAFDVLKKLTTKMNSRRPSLTRKQFREKRKELMDLLSNLLSNKHLQHAFHFLNIRCASDSVNQELKANYASFKATVHSKVPAVFAKISTNSNVINTQREIESLSREFIICCNKKF